MPINDPNDDLLKWAEGLGKQASPPTSNQTPAQKRRTQQQAYKDFRKELEARGVRINSGYRTRAQQEALYRRLPKGQAARPGTSEHERWGAVDLPPNVSQKVLEEAARAARVRLKKQNVHKGTGWHNHQGFTVDDDGQVSAPVGFDFDAALTEADQLLKGQAAPTGQAFDFNAALAEADALLGGDRPTTQPSPTNPVTQTVKTPPALPDQTQTIGGTQKLPVMPESPMTLEAQMTATADMGSSRKATLLTSADQVSLLPKPALRGLKKLVRPEGIIFYNPAKVKNAESMTTAELIGKVDDVADTSQGIALRTERPDGTELSTSIVTSPESAAQQAQVDQSQFPGQIGRQVVTSAQGALQSRDAEYKKWLTDNGFVETPENARSFQEAFDIEQQAKADQTASTAQYGQPQQGVPAQPQAQIRRLTPAEKIQKARERVTQPAQAKGGTFTIETPKELKGSARQYYLGAMASQLAQQYNVSYDTAYKYLAGEIGGGGGTITQLDETTALDLLKSGKPVSVALDDAAVNELKALEGMMVQSRKDQELAKSLRNAEFDQFYNEYIQNGEIPSVAALLVAKDFGEKEVGGVPIDEAIQREREEYKKATDAIQVRPRTAADTRQGIDWKTQAERNQEALNERAAQIRDLVQQTLADNGSFTKRAEERRKASAFERDKPMLAAARRGTELFKGLIENVPQAASAVLRTADIIGEINPLSVQNVAGYVSGKEFKASEGQLYQAANEIDGIVERVMPRNKYLDGYRKAGNSIGQMAIQMGLGVATGGVATPLLYGASLGASSQYQEADKAMTANKKAGKEAIPGVLGDYLSEGAARKFAAILGGATAISDALPLQWALKPVTKGGVGRLLSGFFNTVYKEAVPELGEKAAKELVESTFRRLVNRSADVAKKIGAGAKKVGTGAGLEMGQEVLIDKKINDLYASLTYDPNRKVFEINNDDLETAFYAAIGGAAAGGGRILLEQYVAAETEAENAPKPEDVLSDPNADAIDKLIAQTEIKEREAQPTEVQPTGETQAKDAAIPPPPSPTTAVSPQPAPMGETALETDTDAQGTVSDVQVEESDLKAAKTNLDLIFDRVSKDSEVIIRLQDEISREQLERVQDEAQKRGLHAAFDGNNILVRKMPTDAGPSTAQPDASPKTATPPRKRAEKYHDKPVRGMVLEAPLDPQTLTGAKNRLKEVETELQEERRKGTTDAKMGISNERAWASAVDRIEADPEQEVVSLDINRMKEANDTTSHTGIDKNVLAPIGAAVRKVLKANGIDERNAFRTGGDEIVVAVPKGLGTKIRDEIEKEVGVIEVTATKDFTNDRTGESFKKGDVIPVTISGDVGLTVAEAEKGLGARKRASKDANPVRRVEAKPGRVVTVNNQTVTLTPEQEVRPEVTTKPHGNKTDVSVQKEREKPANRYIVITSRNGKVEIEGVTNDPMAFKADKPYLLGEKYYDTQEKRWVKPGKRGLLTDKPRVQYGEVPSNIEDLADPFYYEKTLAEFEKHLKETSDDTLDATLKAEHAESVKAAIALGLPVRNEVLADYPDLAKEFGGKDAPKDTKAAVMLSQEQQKRADADLANLSPTTKIIRDPSSDPMIGRRWNSTTGQRIVFAKSSMPSGDMYHIVDAENNTYRTDTRDFEKRWIARDEYTEERKQEAERNALRQQKRDDEEKRARETKAELAGFTEGMTPMQRGRVEKALQKKWRHDGKAQTTKQIVDGFAAEGDLRLTTEEVNKIADMSRVQYNRATGQQQEAHERRQKEAGKKTVYFVNGLELGKIAYDYAQYLQQFTDTPAPATKQAAEPAREDGAKSPSYRKRLATIQREMKDEFRARRQDGRELPNDLKSAGKRTDKYFEKALDKYVDGMTEPFIRDWHDTIFNKSDDSGILRQVASLDDMFDPATIEAGDASALDGVYNDNGTVNHDKAKDVAERVASGELEVVRLDRQGERGRIAGGSRAIEASILIGADEARRQKASSASLANVESKSDTRSRQESLFKLADDESKVYVRETLPTAHTQEVLRGVESKFTANNELELTEEAGEIVRRLLTHVNPSDKGGAFFGVTLDRATLRKAGNAAQKFADEYENIGYAESEVKALRDLGDNLIKLSKAESYGVAYIFEDALPEEQHHALVMNAGGISPEAITKLKKNPLWKSARLTREYGKLSDLSRAVEIAAKLETGQDKYWDKISPKDKKAFLQTVASDIIQRNLDDNGEFGLDEQRYERITKYAKNKADNTEGTQRAGTVSDGSQRTEGDAEPARQRDGDQDQAARTRPADEGDGDRAAEVSREKEQRVDSGFTPGGREKLSKTPQTLRERGGIPVEDRPYTSTTNAERIAFANQILDRGIDDAREWLDTQIDDDNNNAGATAVVGIALMNTLGKTGRISELNEVADALLPMVTDAAQTVQAISIVSMFSPDTAIPYATKAAKKAGKDLTKEQAQRAGDIAKRMSETVQALGLAQNSLKVAEEYNKELQKQIKELEDALNLSNTKIGEFKLKLMGQGRTIAALRRQVAGIVRAPRTRTSKEVKEKLDKIASRKDEILANLKAKFGTPAVLRMVAWHGSPHVFEKFDISKIGTGEGAQAYGYGLYFAGKEEVADYYKKQLTDREQLDAKDARLLVQLAQQILGKEGQTFYRDITTDDRQIAEELARNPNFRAANELSKYDSMFELARKAAKKVKTGAKYRVNLKPAEDEYLLWDKPLSEQSEKVKAVLKLIPQSMFDDLQELRVFDNAVSKSDDPDFTGKDLYKDVSLLGHEDFLPFKDGDEGKTGDHLASEYLKSLGIRGIKYLDGSSRSKGEGDYNYVIFDDADVEIAEVFRMAADDTLDQDLLDYATLTLADSIGTVTPEEFKRGINVIANGQLTADELDQIHAYAVNEIHTTKSEQSETIKERARLRRAHYTAAKQYQLAQLDFKGFGVKTEAEKRLAEAIIAAGEEGQFSDEAVWHAFARLNYPTVAEQIRAFRDEFGKLPNEKDILADSERVLVAARSSIRKAQMLKKDDTLTDEDIELIKEQNRVLNREKGAVTREAGNFYGGLVRTKGEIALNTAVDMRRANLLSAVKTHLVNVLGNTGFALSEEIAKLPTTTIDQIASMFTGQRAVALTPKGIASGLRVLLSKDETLANSDWDAPGGRERAITAAKHILMYGGTLADMERHQYSESILREAYPDKKLAKWVDNYINYSFRLLGAEDALFKTYAFRRYIEEAAKVQALNEKRDDPSVNVKERTKELILNPTNAMQVLADDYAHLMTFQNDNPLSSFIAQIKRNRPNVKAAIETIVPYDRTPTNIVLRTLEYSPLGVPMAIFKLKGKEPSKEFRNQFTSPIREDVAPNVNPKELTKEQRRAIEREINRLWSQTKQAEFARVMGRATVGTSLFGAGMALAALGLMAGAMGYDDEDKRERDLAWERRKQGVEPGSILLPFLGVRIQLPVSPATSALTAGATFYEQIKMAKKDTTLAAVDGAKEAFADMASKQPYINATYGLLRDLRKQRYGEFTGNLLSGYVPASAMVRSISEVTDEKERTGSGFRKGEKVNTTERFFKRQWRGFRNSLLKGVPGARNYLVDESTSGVSPEERGSWPRRLIRNFDPFNTRSGVESRIPEGQAPDNTNYLNSPEFKRATTDDLVTIIQYDRESEIDTTELEKALRKKVMNARKAGTFTAEEAKRVNDLLGTNYAPRDTRKK